MKTPPTKTCTKCLETKPATKEYFQYHSTRSTLMAACKKCKYKKQKEWRKKNPDKDREQGRRHYYKYQEKRKQAARAWFDAHKTKERVRTINLRKYSITTTEYQVLLEQQNSVCKICKKPETSKVTTNLAVDHCHITGKIRGLLCNHCNRGLGAFKDKVASLYAAVAYLEEAYGES